MMFKNITKKEQKYHNYKTKNADCSSLSNFNHHLFPNVPLNFKLGSMGGFYTYEEYLNEVDLMFQLYPNLISQRDTIGDFRTHLNRPIY
jgi:carboxypeptidase T